MARRVRWLNLLLVVASVFLAFQPQAVLAWKPDTHVYADSQVAADLVDNQGYVTIAGQKYKVDQRVYLAIANNPTYFNGGAVGPDLFPDIAFGQMVIHPTHTGAFLRYIYQKAWQAQSDSRYSDAEKAQILAFSYGYLTHGAGDLWGHTFANYFAHGVWPSLKEIKRLASTDPDKAAEQVRIIFRHIAVEGYVVHATPGVDNPDEEGMAEAKVVCADPQNPPNPWTKCMVESVGGTEVPDVSDNNTPGVGFDIPTRFLYDAMLDVNAQLPTDAPLEAGDRGVVVNQFLDLEASLQVSHAKYQTDLNYLECNILDPDCHKQTRTFTASTVRGDRSYTVTRQECDPGHWCAPSLTDPADDAVVLLLDLYVRAWIGDLDKGLQHWPDFNLALTRALFDPQTRRDAQNDACSTRGIESTDPNNPLAVDHFNCEQGVGTVDTFIYALDHMYSDGGDPSFINRYLIPMLGLPDVTGDVRALLQAGGNLIDDLFTFLGIKNPISALLTAPKEFVKDKINEYIADEYGVDLEALGDFQKNPSRWTCGDDSSGASLTFALPGMSPITITPSGLFTPAEHYELDWLLGLPADHHVQEAGLPLSCGPLKDSAKLDPQRVAALQDTITTAKLVLLNGGELDRALGNVLVAQGTIKDASLVKTYSSPLNSDGVPANVMIDALAGQTPYWYEMADGDHGWRQDGLPVFYQPGQTGKYERQINPTPPLDYLVGGNGQFPLWESCLLRPAFRRLFTDWENGASNFPDLGDYPSPDPSAPNPPTSSALAVGSPRYTDSGGRTWISGANSFGFSAADEVFAAAKVRLEARTYRAGTPPSLWTRLENPGSFSIPTAGGDGAWTVQYHADDPCHTFEVEGSGSTDPLPPEAVHTATYYLDTTAPTLAISQPASATYVHSGTLTLDYSVTDGGSGVKAFTPTLDGSTTLSGHGLGSGQAINLLTELSLGTHTFQVEAQDNVLNSSSSLVSFEVIVTAESIKEDVKQFVGSGEVTLDEGSSLLGILNAAAQARASGNCATANRIYQAFVNEVEAQSGKGVSATAAAIMTSDAQYLMTHCP